jgi:hypothetical protein
MIGSGVLYGTTLGGGSDGSNPRNGSLVIGSGGVLYGTTESGGTSGSGTVFLTPPATPGGAWTETLLYNFTGSSDGSGPWANVIVGEGVLLGTTLNGGTSGNGTVFSLTCVSCLPDRVAGTAGACWPPFDE